jgi:hypothetical protein
MNVSLNSEQTAQLQQYLNTNDYPSAYRYLADINDNGLMSDSRTTRWLDLAAEINAPDFEGLSFYRSMVRGTALHALNEENARRGLPPATEADFQAPSDRLAHDFVRDIVRDGVIPDFDSIITKDVGAIVDHMDMDMEDWPGTTGAWMPYVGLGLDLFDEEGFYADLRENWVCE